MSDRWTDLRDDLAATIAAGRELPPDHDQALAEAFLERVATRPAPYSHIRRRPTRRVTPARLLSTGILGLACLGFATLQISHQATSSVNLKASPANVAVVPKQWKGPGVPRIVKVPAAPIVKIPVAPIAPKSAP